MKSSLRSPLLHFLLLGSLVFAGERWLMPHQAIHLSAAEVEQLRQHWQLQAGRAPTEPELAAAVQTRVDEEILLNEALSQGLDARDSVARERLLLNLRFAFPDSGADDASLLAEARRLGMNRRDRVVRQRLIERMRQQLGRGATLVEADVQDHIARNADRYARPARLSFRQLFFSSDRRGERLQRDVALAFEQLRAGQQPAADPFLLGHQFSAATEAEIGQRFGIAFAKEITAAPQGRWSGPYASPYGLHLVWIDERQDAQPADPQAVRAQAAYAALTEREQAAMQQGLAQLRQQYRVEIEERS